MQIELHANIDQEKRHEKLGHAAGARVHFVIIFGRLGKSHTGEKSPDDRRHTDIDRRQRKAEAEYQTQRKEWFTEVQPLHERRQPIY